MSTHQSALPSPSALIVGLPTHDQRAVVRSLIELTSSGNLLKRPVHFVLGGGSNIPRARNVVLEQLRMMFPAEDALWVLWLDSDIDVLPNQAAAIGEAI
ncbi:MAG: hypothetical protein C7B45_16125 [Sulfobacillus acidophilus]|uniref:Glycosyl transferase n=1 Tax=Sulfobacillus acidophilus TaxID=53633 RepID=A0A2T2WD76_9FIRM|nr:MAG: hypothetical protein C7B45_16125 [Sulfobacillus acidophilus]